MSFIVAVAQFAPTEDKQANLAHIESVIDRAAATNAALLVLPEYAVYTAPAMDDRFVEHAEPLDGPSVIRVARRAAQYGLTVVLGVNETAGEGRIHNTLVALRDERVIAVYRKVHLYDAFGYAESDRVLAADPQTPAVFEVDGITVGMQTCYDIRFPEVSRSLVDAGAELLALPAEWVPGPLKEHHWNTLLRARAIENTVYLAAADQCAPTGAGNSVILDPMGTVLADAGERTDVITAEVSAERLAAVRTVNPALALRRYRVTPGRPA